MEIKFGDTGRNFYNSDNIVSRWIGALVLDEANQARLNYLLGESAQGNLGQRRIVAEEES